jgi:hypothetical protein
LAATRLVDVLAATTLEADGKADAATGGVLDGGKEALFLGSGGALVSPGASAQALRDWLSRVRMIGARRGGGVEAGFSSAEGGREVGTATVCALPDAGSGVLGAALPALTALAAGGGAGLASGTGAFAAVATALLEAGALVMAAAMVADGASLLGAVGVGGLAGG